MNTLNNKIKLDKEFLRVCEGFSDVLKVYEYNEIKQAFSNLTNNEQKQSFINDLYNTLKERKEEKIENGFNDFLDDIYEPVKIGGTYYNYSFVYERVDPIAYKIDKKDYASMMLEVLEIVQEMEEME